MSYCEYSLLFNGINEPEKKTSFGVKKKHTHTKQQNKNVIKLIRKRSLVTQSRSDDVDEVFFFCKQQKKTRVSSFISLHFNSIQPKTENTANLPNLITVHFSSESELFYFLLEQTYTHTC